MKTSPNQISNDIHDLTAKVRDVNFTTVRMVKESAKQVLIENTCVRLKGKDRHFMIRDIGLGVCEVSLLPSRSDRQTCVVDQEQWLNLRGALLDESAPSATADVAAAAP